MTYYKDSTDHLIEKMKKFEDYVRDTPTIKKLFDSFNEFLRYSEGSRGFLKTHHYAAERYAAERTKEILGLMAEYKRRKDEIADEMKKRLETGISDPGLMKKVLENDAIDKKIDDMVEFLFTVGHDLIDYSRYISDYHERLKREE